jgi:hypothetical protein
LRARSRGYEREVQQQGARTLPRLSIWCHLPMLSNACDHMVSSLGTLQLLTKEMIVFASLVFSCDFFSMMNHGSGALPGGGEPIRRSSPPPASSTLCGLSLYSLAFSIDLR